MDLALVYPAPLQSRMKPTSRVEADDSKLWATRLAQNIVTTIEHRCLFSERFHRAPTYTGDDHKALALDLRVTYQSAAHVHVCVAYRKIR